MYCYPCSNPSINGIATSVAQAQRTFSAVCKPDHKLDAMPSRVFLPSCAGWNAGWNGSLEMRSTKIAMKMAYGCVCVETVQRDVRQHHPRPSSMLACCECMQYGPCTDPGKGALSAYNQPILCVCQQQPYRDAATLLGCISLWRAPLAATAGCSSFVVRAV